MTRRILALCAIVVAALVFSAGVTAEEKVIVLKSGARIRGQVTQTADGYKIETSGGTYVLTADQVESIEDVVTASDELKQRLAKADPKDPEAIFAVAQWAEGAKLFREARDLLRKVLELDPDHRQAQLRLKLLEMRLAAQTQPIEPTTRGAGDTGAAADKSKFLTDEDIYRIRLMELRENDTAVIEFRNRVLDRFIDAMRGQGIFAQPDGERRFRSATKVQQARYMIENTEADSYDIRDDILVKSDPNVMRTFKARVWPIVANNCASPSCHGGAKGSGGLQLLNVTSVDDNVIYTNFYILHSWSRGGRDMIRRDKPDISLILQYGLPQKLARLPHPKQTESAFRSREDRNFRVVEDWIGQLRWPFLPPGYRIEYKPPGAPATEPTTRPSIFD